MDKIINEDYEKINLQDNYIFWENLINLLLKKNYKDRPNIEEIYDLIKKYNNKNSITLEEDLMNKKKIYNNLANESNNLKANENINIIQKLKEDYYENIDLEAKPIYSLRVLVIGEGTYQRVGKTNLIET